MTVTATATAPNHDFLRVTESVPVFAGQKSEATLELPAGSLLSGTVTDAVGGPAARTLLLIADTGPGAPLAAFEDSDASGYYEFRDVPSGSYRLRIIESGRTLFFPFTVSAPAALDFDVSLPILRDVNVRVLFEREDGTAHPAQSAPVRVQDSQDAAFRTPVFTNASGEALVPDVAGGPFTVRVTHPMVAASVTDFIATIDAPGPTLPLTFTIPSFGTAAGLVKFGDGATGAASAKVEIEGSDIPFSTVTASAAGAYSFSNVRAVRPFTVVARHPALNRGHIQVSQFGGPIPFQGSTFALDLTLPKTSTVSVLVEEENGDDIAGADVTLQDSFSTGFRSEGTTNASGTRAISFVPFGAFVVRATLGGIFIGEATGEVSVHGDTVAVTITRPSDATVEGTVVAGDGETPVENALVEILSVADGTPLASATLTDANGFYRFLGAVPPGTSARVTATFPGNASLTVETTVTATSPGETLTANLEFPVTVVKGRVLEFDGLTEVLNAAVTVHPVGTREAFLASVKPDGSFVLFEQPEGFYEIVAEDSSGLVGRAQGELVDFLLEQDVLLPEHGTVEVLSFGAFPVQLTNANVLRPREVFAEPSGACRFERVAFGSFSVVSGDPSLPAQAVGELSALEVFAQVELEVPETGTVSGEVLDSSGVPLPANGDTFLTIEERKRETPDGIYAVSPSTFDGSSYSDSAIPEGEVSVTALNFALNEAGLASGTLPSGGTLALDPQLGSAVFLPYAPEPSAPETHEVGADGVVQGSMDSQTEGSVSFARVSVNQKGYPALSVAELAGSEVILGSVRLAGIEHTRRVHVPAGAPYARIVDVLENPNAVSMEVTVSFESFLSVPESFTEVAGSTIAGANGDGTAVAVVYGDGAMPPDSTERDSQRFREEWRTLTIPAGGQLVLVHFAIQAPDLAAAISLASSLANAPPLSDLPEVLNFEP